jgi:hypothetical protein
MPPPSASSSRRYIVHIHHVNENTNTTTNATLIALVEHLVIFDAGGLLPVISRLIKQAGERDALPNATPTRRETTGGRGLGLGD